MDEEKSIYIGVRLRKLLWLSVIAQFAVADKRRSNTVHMQKRV